jgi:hypothetical protein
MLSRYRRLYAYDQRLARDATTPQLDDSHVTQKLPWARAGTPLACRLRRDIRTVADSTEVIDDVLDVCKPDGLARLAQQVCLPLGMVENEKNSLAYFPPCMN